ncbi:hypothetical protein MMC22_011492 [Lobaria immixta]|nr:hypothetical protein [Lobaria immixta]
METARDIPVRITSATISSERRITPSWTIAQLKDKLELITGIPNSSQKLTVQHATDQEVVIETENEDRLQVGSFVQIPYTEIKVTHKTGTAVPKVADVPKWVMPSEVYSARPSTVLAYKKAHQVGRFDPAAPEILEQKIAQMWKEIEERGIIPNARCCLSGTRHGTIRYVGLVPELDGPGPWVGIELDEPTGKNDGSLNGTRYFDAKPSTGVFVREKRVEVGQFGVLLEEELGSDMEEL